MSGIPPGGTALERSFLDRPRIDRLLDEAVRRSVVTVTAGAGYGKTHAVYTYVHRRPCRLVWLGLTAQDNSTGRFWESFTAAVRNLSERSAASLAEIGFPSTDRKFDRYLRVPQEDVDPKKRYFFVFDDVHLIHNPQVLRFLEQSIATPFSNITSILLSRTDLSLNLSLSGLETRGLVARIVEEDLKFSMEEMRNYFALRGLRPAEQKTGSVYQLCDGWAFALRLSGEILLRENAGGSGLNWNIDPGVFRANIWKMIEKEILFSAGPELRKFLVKLSLITIHQADLLREIGGGAMMEELNSIGAFINLDTYTGVYRIHPLLLEYFATLGAELSEKEKKELFRTTAQWCRQRGQKLAAISYYDKAEQYPDIFNLIYTMGFMVNEQSARFLWEIMGRLPQEVYDRQPEGYNIRIKILLSLLKLDEAEAEINAGIAMLEGRDDAMTNPTIALNLMGLFNLRGILGLLRSQSTGDYRFAEPLERACEYFAPFSGSYVTAPPLSVHSVGTYICRVSGSRRGEMEAFLDALALYASRISVSMGGAGYGMDDLGRAELAFFRAEIPRAEEFLHRALKKAREKNQYEIENRALFYLLRVALLRGDTGRIKTVLKELENQLSEEFYINRSIYYDMVSGWFYIQIGQLGNIAAWLKSEFVESDLNSQFQGHEIVVKTRYHLANHEYPLALASLQCRGNQNELNDFLLGRIARLTLETVCRYKNGERERSFALFREAILLAEPNGLYMPFTELGRHMRTITAAILETEEFFLDGAVSRDLVTRINTAASAYSKRLTLVEKEFRGRSQSPAEELSSRERKTLVGLYQGLTGEEIALETDLSINTVKSITKRIYAKLGAANKADAIRIALEAGILGDEKRGEGGEKRREAPAKHRESQPRVREPLLRYQ